jgi:predicted DsbA family dithiol-disulfide isomerase
VLEEAARRFGAQIGIRWHAYELRPEPAPLPDPDGEYIAEHWHRRVLPMAAERGLTMRLPRRLVRSRRALQAACFARDHGRFGPVDRALFQARFEEDLDISDPDVVARIGANAGLDGLALMDAILADRYLDAVLADIRLAARIGISGVPAMLVGPETGNSQAFFGEAEPVVGAVPLEWLAEAIERAIAGDHSVARQRRRFRADWKLQ